MEQEAIFAGENGAGSKQLFLGTPQPSWLADAPPSLPVHSCFSFQMNDLWGGQVSVISQQGMCGIMCVRFYAFFGKYWLHMPSLSFWPSP